MDLTPRSRKAELPCSAFLTRRRHLCLIGRPRLSIRAPIVASAVAVLSCLPIFYFSGPRRIGRFFSLCILALAMDALGQGTVLMELPRSNPDTVVYVGRIGGLRAEGTNFLAQLYAGTSSATELDLLPVSKIVPFRTGNGAGRFYVMDEDTRVVAIPGVPPGQRANVQIRTWSAKGGGTYEDALSAANLNPHILVGKSKMITVFTGGPGLDPPSYGVPLDAVRSFALQSVALALEIQRTTDSLELTWPGYASNYVLQASSRVDGTNWVEVPGPFALQNGRFTATSEVVGKSQFFRLRRK